MDAFIGEIRAFGFNYQAVGWVPCDGRLLPVVPYQALYAVIGNTYGGTANQNFAVPDFRGRAPMHSGTAGTNAVAVGAVVGVQSVALTQNQLAPHNHGAQGIQGLPNGAGPSATSYPGLPAYGTAAYDAWTTSAPTTTLAPTTIGPIGGPAPHSNISPFLAMNMCICTDGAFPVRG